ncbi:MAG: hypothetical protein V4482_05830 [Pseudomonadota bacterium]
MKNSLPGIDPSTYAKTQLDNAIFHAPTPRRRSRQNPIDFSTITASASPTSGILRLPPLASVPTEPPANLFSKPTEKSPLARRQTTAKSVADAEDPTARAETATIALATPTDIAAFASAPLPIQQPEDPISFERNINRILNLHLFPRKQASIDLIEAILSKKDAEQRDYITNHLIRIFNYLQSKRLDQGNPSKERYLRLSQKEAKSILNLVSSLFVIPEAIEINPSFLFIELNYTNKNPQTAILFLNLMEQFFINNYTQQKALDACRLRFSEVTHKMKRDFHFAGKIPNHEVTKAYIDALVSELNEPF